MLFNIVDLLKDQISDQALNQLQHSIPAKTVMAVYS